jgi:hypothetical protein
LLISTLVLMALPTLVVGDAPDFDRRIAPLLAEHCLDCHSGPKPKGGLDLSRKATAFKGGDGGPGVVPGKPDDSGVWRRVQDGEMPPKKPLEAGDRALLRNWIAGGAVWGRDPIDPFRFTTKTRAGTDWWSLQPVRRPDLPEVKNTTWARNAVDRFVLAKLEARGLTPSPEADRRTLVRRLSFDLLGLPPTPELVEAFVADRRPDAYERLVDQLLASPHYGERWGRHWLDVVRYGESDGFERNASRTNAWPYRDWVINAFNSDSPYDEFCRLQIAGDVIRPGDADAAKATGFLVAGIHNTVLPATKVAQETAFQDELEDLVGGVGQTFLGLTVNCARCHDHKFDPVAQRDYYRLASAFSGVRPGEREVISRVHDDELARLQAEAERLQKTLDEIEEPARQTLLAERKKGKAAGVGPTPIAAWDFRSGGKDRVGKLDVRLVGGASLTGEGLVLDGSTGFARTEALTRELREKTLEVWVRLRKLDQAGGGAMTVETLDGGVFDAVVFGERDPRRWMAGSEFFARTAGFDGAEEQEATSRTVQLTIVYAADGTVSGYRNGRPYGKSYRSNGPVVFPAGKSAVAFGIRHAPAGGNKMLAGIVVQARLYDRALTTAEVAASTAEGGFVTEAELSARLTPDVRRKRDDARTRLAAIGTEQARLRVARSLKVYTAVNVQPAATHVLLRGQADAPGDVVPPGGIPVVAAGRAEFGLKPDAAEGERRRKAAEWLTARDNPLFHRVIVNRLWHYHFGTGIVESPNDFGFNGGRPSHPELLDYLADELVADGYRLKALQRLIVTSAAYRQSSAPRPEGLAVDAEARLLWRKRPVRLDGEVLRDGMLAAAGLLNREIGGRGFSDYKQVGGAGTEYYDPYDPVGPEYHRRSVYRFLPRGGNQGLLDLFDCPDPASAAPRRNTTTTPLQALTLWNGPFALRMAAALSDRVTAEAKSDVDRQVALAYRLTYQREPTTTERSAARELVERHGLKVLCRALFNSNEFLTVD